MAKILRKKRTHKPATRKSKNDRNRKHQGANPKLIPDQALRASLGTKAGKGTKASNNKNLTYTQQIQKLNRKGLLETEFGQQFPDAIPDTTYNPVKLNEDQVPVVKALYKKHKQDYAAMARDIRINKWQWTAMKCQKFVEGYCVQGNIKQRSLEAENMSGRGMDLDKPVSVEGKKRNVFGH